MRLQLCRIADTSVYLHTAGIVFGAYMILTGHGGLLMVGILSAFLHECGHCVASIAAGQPPREIELSPLGAVMRLDEHAAMSAGWQWVMLFSGPAVTLLLCATSLWFTSAGWIPIETGRMLFMCNIAILLVNLLPALPLDGGRMLALGLGMCFRVTMVNAIMRAISTGAGLICILLNLFVAWRMGGWNLSLAACGCFMLYAGAVCTVSTPLTELRAFLDRKIRMERKKSLPVYSIAALGETTLRHAVSLLHQRRHTVFWVMSDHMRRAYPLPEQQVIEAYLSEPSGSLEKLVHGRGGAAL